MKRRDILKDLLEEAGVTTTTESVKILEIVDFRSKKGKLVFRCKMTTGVEMWKEMEEISNEEEVIKRWLRNRPSKSIEQLMKRYIVLAKYY